VTEIMGISLQDCIPATTATS